MPLHGVIPIFNEKSNLQPLWERLEPDLVQTGPPVKVIFVGDGSSVILKELHQRDNRIRLVWLQGDFGKSVALHEGLPIARGSEGKRSAD